MKKTFQIYGSYGQMVADAESGKVESYDHDDDGEPEYDDIDRFNVKEWTETYKEEIGGTHLDILDVGFWTKTNEYIAPEAEWRKATGRTP